MSRAEAPDAHSDNRSDDRFGAHPDGPPGTPPAAHPIVRARELVKTHHGEGAPVKAVRGVDLDIERGEFVAVTGPSGAGKSTLLHLLGGLQRPDSGGIWFDGTSLDSYGEAQWAVLRRRRIGIVFQFFNLVSNLTVADNVELPALLAGRGPKRARADRAELLEELGLAGKERSMPGELSGGEQQRVSVARAFVNRPLILLADEPTGNLDSQMARGVMEMLEEINAEGTTIVMVTHDSNIVNQMRRRVIEIENGQIVRDQARGVYG